MSKIAHRLTVAASDVPRHFTAFRGVNIPRAFQLARPSAPRLGASLAGVNRTRVPTGRYFDHVLYKGGTMSSSRAVQEAVDNARKTALAHGELPPATRPAASRWTTS